jgi:hypothetical protein
MPPVQERWSKLPILGAIAAVVLLLAAVGAIFLLSPSNSWDPGAEPSPPGTWQAFTCPDGSWSVMFPGSASPRLTTQTTDTGFGTITIEMYVTTDGAAAYEAAAVDMPSAALNGDTDSILSQFEQGMMAGTGGKIIGSRRLTFKTYDAREIKFTALSLDGYARFWLAGDRIYALMVMAEPGTTMYPEHFFDSFDMN